MKQKRHGQYGLFGITDVKKCSGERTRNGTRSTVTSAHSNNERHRQLMHILTSDTLPTKHIRLSEGYTTLRPNQYNTNQHHTTRPRNSPRCSVDGDSLPQPIIKSYDGFGSWKQYPRGNERNWFNTHKRHATASTHRSHTDAATANGHGTYGCSNTRNALLDSQFQFVSGFRICDTSRRTFK